MLNWVFGSVVYCIFIFTLFTWMMGPQVAGLVTALIAVLIVNLSRSSFPEAKKPL